MSADETAIRALLETRAQANRDKDADAALRLYADHIVNFDLPPPLAVRGKEATDPKALEEWFDSWDGAPGIELGETTIRIDGDLAVAFGFFHLHGKRTDGSTTDSWARSTVCLRRDGEHWLIFHEHASFPMKMDGSKQVADDLEPETFDAG